MRKSLSLLVLVVVMGAVLLLVAEAWKRFGPAAVAVRDARASEPLDDHGQTQAGDELRSGRLPRLREAQERTDAHAGDVRQALDSGE